MKSKVFEYLILLHEEDKPTVVLVPLKQVLAKNENEAQILAARDIPDPNIADLDKIEIVLRPF